MGGASGTATGQVPLQELCGCGLLWQTCSRKLGCLAEVRAFVCGIIPVERTLPLGF